MKIESQNSSIQLGAYLRQVQNQQTASELKRQSTGGKITSFDKVQLSQRALELQHAQQMLLEIPDVRADKVEKVRSAVNEGTYQVSGISVARSMLRETFENQMLLEGFDAMA